MDMHYENEKYNCSVYYTITSCSAVNKYYIHINHFEIGFYIIYCISLN